MSEPKETLPASESYPVFQASIEALRCFERLLLSVGFGVSTDRPGCGGGSGGSGSAGSASSAGTAAVPAPPAPTEAAAPPKAAPRFLIFGANSAGIASGALEGGRVVWVVWMVWVAGRWH